VLGYSLVLAISLGLLLSPVVSTWEQKMLDEEFNILRSSLSADADDNIVLIGIDDKTTAEFPEPMALWHRHFGALFRALSSAKPLVVGLDIALPDRSFKFIDQGLDRALMMGMKQLSSTAPLVIGMTVNANGETRKIYPPLVSIAGENSMGYMLWHRDHDQIVRRFSEALGDHGESTPTLVGAMARHLKLSVHAGLIDYTIGAPIEYIPMHRVVAWGQAHDIDKLRDTFANKVVFIGSVLPFIDRHFQVTNLAAWEDNRNFAPGVLLHVQALRSLQYGGMIEPIKMQWVVLGMLLLTLLWWLPLSRVAAMAALSMLGGGLFGASILILKSGFYVPIVILLLTSVIALMGRQLQQLFLDEIERRRLRRAFSGSVSPQVMSQILEGRLPEGERCTVCVLFSDIRSFTTRSEKMAPEDVVMLLNRYFEQMTMAIHGHNGTLDKFIGDGMMAFFGAPNQLDNPSMHAFHAALDMLNRLDNLNEQFKSEGIEPVRIGIGLHVGEVVVGQLGSHNRSEYTAIGDTVNTAARIEGLTKQMGMALIISEAAYQQIASESDVSRLTTLGTLPIRGRSSLHLYGYDNHS